MWIVRWILIAVVIVLILLFSLQNQEQRVSVNIGYWTSPDMPLYFALFIAFVIGLFVWFIVASFQILQLKSHIKSCRRDNKKLQDELTALRNLPLEETEEKPQPGEQPESSIG